MNLQPSYRVAEGIMRKNASSFYAAFEKIEHEKFLDIAAVYAFCRYADDLADTELQSKAIRLQLLNLLEEDVKSLYDCSSQSENYKKYPGGLPLRMPLEFVKFRLKHCLSRLMDRKAILILKS